MKAITSETILSKKISQELEMRVDQAVDAFMKGIEQLLVEESFQVSKPLHFSKQIDHQEWLEPQGYILN